MAPQSTLLGEYGVQGYNVGYNADTYVTSSKLLRTNSCVLEAAQTGLSTVAPTFIEGWRLTTL